MKSVIKTCIIQSKEKKKIKYREELAEEGFFSIPLYNKSSSTCIPNITTPANKVVENSVKNLIIKSMEGKTTGQIQRISRRMLVLNPTIQVVINLHT